ncbi:MAG: hypothetical protein DRJ05_06710 [Bacteroidetes bacterium]|nr:MAG: hypothetical protein DRJ05_06710 [Bacteroidota bacterium]
MKKTLLFSLALSLFISGFSQKHIPTPKDLREKAVKMEYRPGHKVQSKYTEQANPSKSVYVDENQIGITQYDLQTNSSLGNRLWLFDDNTVGGVWTRGVESAPNFPDRGTGYNYFDGDNWGEETGPIESVRAGWPSYAAWGENGEMIVAHDFGAGTLLFNRRETKGNGEWTEVEFEGPGGEHVAWARMVTSGENNEIIHNICITKNPYEDQTNALLYSRSSDGGETWDIENEILDGTGIDDYSVISADDYTWAEPRAGVIAFVVSSTWTSDWFIMKSEDEGENWEKIMVWEHPYPFYDWDATVFTDTLWAPDGGADVAIDENGKVHTVSGLCRVQHDEVGTSYFLYPYSEGIVYWNEDMPEFSDGNPHHALSVWDDVLIPDETLIGWGQDVDGSGEYELLDDIQYYRTIGLQTMPNVTCSDGQIFVVWAGTTELAENGSGFNYKRIWMRGSSTNGNDWGAFMNMNSDLTHLFHECIYPVLAGSTDENVHMVYQFDELIGTAMDEDHEYVENSLTYAKASSVVFTGLGHEKSNSTFVVSQNFPNPFTKNSVVKVYLPEKSNLTLEVSNFIGQKVFAVDAGMVDKGSYNFNLNADKLSKGVYFYTITAGNQKTTRKMIIK